MKIILVPLDGSALAEHVLPYLPLLAAALDARVLLIEAVCELEFATAAGAVAGEVEVGVGREPRWEPQIGWDLRREHAASYLESHAARLRERGLEVATEVCAGAPAEVIVEVASRHRTALVAMATHGYTGLRRWARGSVANQVVQMCCVPVFLVRGAARPMGIGTRLRRILVPLDETARSPGVAARPGDPGIRGTLRRAPRRATADHAGRHHRQRRGGDRRGGDATPRRPDRDGYIRSQREAALGLWQRRRQAAARHDHPDPAGARGVVRARRSLAGWRLGQAPLRRDVPGDYDRLLLAHSSHPFNG